MNTIDVITQKGYPVTLTIFEAHQKANTLVIIAPATGVKQTYYKHFATYLSENGIDVITFDYGGIGLSKKQLLQQFDTSAFDWGHNDLEHVIAYGRENYSNAKVILIGHSIGGQLIGLSASSRYVHKILLVGAQSGYWKFWKGTEKYKMWANWYLLFPLLTNLFGYLPSSKFSAMEDLPKTVARQWRKWCISPDYLFDEIPPEHLNYDNITCEIRSYSADDDSFAPQEAVDWMTGKYKNAILQRVHLLPGELSVKKIGHFGFFHRTLKDPIWKAFLNDIK